MLNVIVPLGSHADFASSVDSSFAVSSELSDTDAFCVVSAAGFDAVSLLPHPANIAQVKSAPRDTTVDFFMLIPPK